MATLGEARGLANAAHDAGEHAKAIEIALAIRGHFPRDYQTLELLGRLYLEGRILELLALRLAQLSDAPLAQVSAALSRKQIERLHEARAVIGARMAAPPSLRELSQQVALSTTLLKRGFRHLFGETVFEHLRNLRLDRARELLLEEGASVKETAWSVGYASLSHFARAFGERFGASPRAWARNARSALERERATD